jgi:hypothetical protein
MNSDNSKTVLVSLLKTVVRGWGWRAVVTELEKLLASQHAGEGDFADDLRSLARRSRKPKSAVDLVEALTVPEEKKSTILQIAEKFDRKNFLPSLGDMREFLAMRGGGRPVLHDRQLGFRRILELLREMPLDQLDLLATSRSFSGPAQLAPLSEAIGATGRTRRGNLSTDDLGENPQEGFVAEQKPQSKT